MPNGFQGSRERWKKMEAPFLQIDSLLERFAKTHSTSIGKNHHNWPERSLIWSDRKMSKLIQIYLEGGKREAYCIWLCVSEDRGSKRYLKQQMLLNGVPWNEVFSDVERHLEEGRRIIESWSSADLEFAVDINNAP